MHRTLFVVADSMEEAEAKVRAFDWGDNRLVWVGDFAHVLCIGIDTPLWKCIGVFVPKP